jgi:hypothetical protein
MQVILLAPESVFNTRFNTRHPDTSWVILHLTPILRRKRSGGQC